MLSSSSFNALGFYGGTKTVRSATLRLDEGRLRFIVSSTQRGIALRYFLDVPDIELE